MEDCDGEVSNETVLINSFFFFTHPGHSFCERVLLCVNFHYVIGGSKEALLP